MITSAQSDTQHLLGPISHQIHKKSWKRQPFKITSQPQTFLNYIYGLKISKIIFLTQNFSKIQLTHPKTFQNYIVALTFRNYKMTPKFKKLLGDPFLGHRNPFSISYCAKIKKISPKNNKIVKWHFGIFIGI